MKNTKFLPFDASYSKFRSCYPVEAEYNEYVDLLRSGMTTEQHIVKLNLPKPSSTGVENYQYLQQIWKQQKLSSFRDFLRWYNNKDVVPF